MVNVIVLFPKQEIARSIRNLLVRSGFEVTAVCATGAQVVQRMEGVEEGLVVCGYKCSDMIYSELREYLSPIYDLERLISKVAYKSANPRDLIALLNSLKMLPHIKTVIQDFKSPLFKEITEDLDVLDDITSLIDNSINEDPPINIKEGGIIKEGYNEEVDRLRKAKTEGKTWLAELD